MRAEIRPFKPPSAIAPDAFQVNAVRAAMEGKDVLVVAPTGSGKTWIAEQIAARSLEVGAGFVYASPLKALSNQKYRDFCRLFGEENVGIITGDVTVNGMAPLLVMTTEILRNKCLCSPADLDRVGWITIDEFHLIDSDRGAAWEESVIFAPGHIRLLCLSATVPNYDEVAAWLSYVRNRRVEVIVEARRPVPLSWRWFIKGRVFTEKTIGREIEHLRGVKRREGVREGVKRKAKEATSLSEPFRALTALIDHLISADRYPALIFAFSRRLVEEMAEATVYKFRLLDEDAKAFVTEYVDNLPQSVADIHGNLLLCLPHGIGFHHAGLLPKAKAAVEELFLRGYLPVVFCTETFAMGVNFPARTVVFAATTKRADEGYRPLTAREMLQISGRAGRRGIDTRGYAYVLVDPQYPEEVPVLAPREPEPLAPELVLTYEGVLRLIFRLGVAGEDAIKTYFRKGFSAYRMREPLISLTRELEDLQRQRDVLLRAEGCPLRPEGCPGAETECAEKIMRKRRSLATQIGQWEKQKRVALGKMGTRRERKARVLLALAEQRLSALEHELSELPQPQPCPQGPKVLGGGRCPVFSAVATFDKRIRRLRAKLGSIDVAEAIWHQFMRSRTALERAGFIDDLSLTPKGSFALACGPGGVLFAEIMAEIAGVGIVGIAGTDPGTDQYKAEPAEIAGYAAGSLCEDEERSSPARFLPLPVAKAVGSLRSNGLEVMYSVKDALAVETWASGQDVLTASSKGDMAPGDFVMLARRAAETLRGAGTEERFLRGMTPVLTEALREVWRDEVADVL